MIHWTPTELDHRDADATYARAIELTSDDALRAWLDAQRTRPPDG